MVVAASAGAADAVVVADAVDPVVVLAVDEAPVAATADDGKAR